MTTPTPIRQIGGLPGLYKPSSRTQESFGLCIYGRSGSGKTTLCGTMPGKGLIIDVPQIEGGTFVLENVADHIDVVPVDTWNDIDKIYWFLAKEKHDYRWVAIDSITAMQELAKRKTIGERDLQVDPHQISLQEYGKIGRLVGELVYKFRVLKIHTIWIAQERTAREGDSGPTMTGPDLIPSATSALLPSMLLVGRLSNEQADDGTWERRLRIGSHIAYYTKYRAAPGLDVPAVVRNPNLKQLLAYLLGVRPERPEEAVSTSFIIS